MAQFQVVLKKGPEPGKIFLLSNNEMTIGRDVKNEIALNDAEISRKHCRLTFQGSGYAIEDLGSTNGTTVNNKVISAAQMLKGGDKIQCGDNVILEYQVVGADAEATIISHGGLPDPASLVPPTIPQPAAPVAAQPPVQQSAPPAKKMIPSPKNGSEDRRKQILLAGGLIVLIGGCIAIAILWIIDANALWCDIFGNSVCQGLARMIGQ